MTASDLPLLVVVTGPPAAGKTTVARGIAQRLRLPLVEKDTIKEALFDTLGTGDLAWSRRLGEATYGVIWALREAVESGRHDPLAKPHSEQGLTREQAMAHQGRFFETGYVPSGRDPPQRTLRPRAEKSLSARAKSRIDSTA